MTLRRSQTHLLPQFPHVQRDVDNILRGTSWQLQESTWTPTMTALWGILQESGWNPENEINWALACHQCWTDRWILLSLQNDPFRWYCSYGTYSFSLRQRSMSKWGTQSAGIWARPQVSTSPLHLLSSSDRMKSARLQGEFISYIFNPGACECGLMWK